MTNDCLVLKSGIFARREEEAWRPDVVTWRVSDAVLVASVLMASFIDEASLLCLIFGLLFSF